MKHWRRWAVLIGGGLVAAVMIGAGLLAYLVLRLDVRAEVERAVESATGRDLVIAGNVGVSYWPVLGLRAEDATLANVAGGRAPVFLATDAIRIGVEIGPLLNREVVVRRLALSRPRIALEVDAEGRPNWILAPRRAEGPPPPRPPEPAVELARANLREVRISDGEISFYDARRGSGWIVGDADIRTALMRLDRPMRVQGSIRYNDRPVEIDAEIAQPGALMRGEATPLKVDLESELLNAAFDGQTLAASGEFAGTVGASGPSLRQLAAWTGSPLQGAAGFEQFEVAGRIQIVRGVYSFSNAGFVIDLVRGRGDFVLSEVRGKPYLSGRLQLFDFDLNPYLTGRAPPSMEGPPAAEAGAPSTEIAAVEAAPRAVDVRAAPSQRPLDFAGLQAFNADLELVTAAVLVQHMRVDSARLNLVLHDGYLAATLHNMGLYGGSGRGRIEIDARGPAIRISPDLAFTGLDARAFLTDAVNFSNIEGRAELSLDLDVAGGTQAEMIASADGRAHIEVVSGTLHGVDLGGVSTTIRNALRGELIAPEARTPFHGFSATFAVADGVMASDSMSFNTPDLRITGIGVIDVPRRRLDARLAPRSPRGGVVVPFAVRGPFGQFSYAGDLSDRAQREILARVREVEATARSAR